MDGITNNPNILNAAQQFADLGQKVAETLAGGSNDGKVKDKRSELVGRIGTLVQETVRILTSKPGDNTSVSGVSSPNNSPSLDDPEDAEHMLMDLEKLLADLQAKQDEKQIKLQQKIISSEEKTMSSRHSQQLKKIEESIEAAKKAKTASLLNRIFGWLGAIFAVVTAVVMTVATGGVAAGVAIAGAAIAVTSLVLNETGASEKITKALADHLKKTYGMSSAKANAWAQGIYGGIFMVLGIATAAASLGTAAKAAADIASSTMRTIVFATQITNTVNGLASTGVGAYSTSAGYQTQKTEAEVREMSRWMAAIQQMLDESSQELEEILAKLQGVFQNLIEILQSKSDTGNAIIDNMTQMI